MKALDTLKQIQSLREEADRIQSKIITDNRKLIIELAEMIFLLKKEGRLQGYEREALTKMMTNEGPYRTTITIGGYSEIRGESHNPLMFTVCFENYEPEGVGWTSYFGYPNDFVYVRPQLIEDHTKLDAHFTKKKQEWSERDDAAALKEKEDRRNKLRAQLDNIQ